MFWRRKPKPELTSESYYRWLRAQRPPWIMFLERTEDEQEALAVLGDAYVVDICIGIGKAVVDPVAAEAGLDAATNVDSEEILLQRIAGVLRGREQGAAQQSPQRQPLSMGGVSKRREARAAAEQLEVDESRSFMGHRPDSIRNKGV